MEERSFYETKENIKVALSVHKSPIGDSDETNIESPVDIFTTTNYNFSFRDQNKISFTISFFLQ